MSVVSGAQFGAARQAWTNPYAAADDPTALGDINGGWNGGESPAAQGGQNLTTAQRNMSWRTPSREALGTNTIGSWYGFGSPWHERYKNSD